MCFFCGAGIPQSHPDRRILIFVHPEEDNVKMGSWYSCHKDCAAENGWFYADPSSPTERAARDS
jgi:hypothetical protein